MIDPEVREIGVDLARYAEREAEFSAQRGLVEELFPYIYAASKRMSVRAISRWLLEEKKIKLGPVTIAKALREADKHWEAYADEIEPAARIVAAALDMTVTEVLGNPEAFFGLSSSETLNVAGQEGFSEYRDARDRIEHDWYGLLDDVARESCLQFITDDEEEAATTDKGGEKDAKRGKAK